MIDILTVRVGHLGTNCYIVSRDGGRECVLVDPGADAERIEETLTRANLTPKAVLLTHAHFDHIGAARHFQSKGVPVYLHKAGMPVLEGTLSVTHAGISIERFTPDRLLSDGDVLNICGLTFEVIHTPGHSTGSVCYICDDSMFSGDTLFYLSIGRTDFPFGSQRDMTLSLGKLFSLPNNYKVFPGHGKSTELMFEKANNPYA